MNHLTDEQLLLHAYGELPDAPAADAHLGSCDACRTKFRRLAEAQAGAEWGVARGHARRMPRIAWLALPLAAAIGAVLLWPARRPPVEREPWQSHLVASPTAGYVTGAALISIDSQLTRLERGGAYGTRMD